MRIVPLVLLTSVVLLPGCAPERSGEPERDRPGADEPGVVRPAATEGSTPASPVPSDGRGPRVVFLGTSLTEGLGLADPATESWPARVGALADSAGIPVQIVNAGVAGETSAGALARVEWVLSRGADVLVVETGGNDALRALPPEALEANLLAMVRRARELRPELEVVLVPMEAPTNLGSEYTARFREAYGNVARRESVPLTPFLLEGVATVPSLNQADGIHPTAEGHRILARNAWPALEPIFRAAAEAVAREREEGGR